ncbi:MAG: orotidine-5'-phosphate decarboxylase [Candidatus Omnitrophica bacterium]|nr:orotidine-5'-phosphate decarboxylase [Candidatus Omnitrophota bacterium]
MSKSPQLIVALDVNTLAEVRELMEKLDPVVDIYKVGSQLFTASGPAAVRFVEVRGKKVFLDLKFHDIPNTVASAVTSSVGLNVAIERSMDIKNRKKPLLQSVFMFTVHTCGGAEMMKAAVEAAAKASKAIGVERPLVVGVTVLTSDSKQDNLADLVLERAKLAKAAGLDGVVASCHEAKMLREKFGPDFVIVTPGIRPAGDDVGDQKRVATPAQAKMSGSSFLVVGRPIVGATNPLQAAKNILKEISAQ